MKLEERLRAEHLLREVPAGMVSIHRQVCSPQAEPLLNEQFSVKTEGKGKLEMYSVFPGIQVSYTLFLASDVMFHHAASPSMLELYHCRSGRVGWNMRDGAAIYLGAGDLTVHSTTCCADSVMMFPLEYAEGISIWIDLACLQQNCPEILLEAGLNPEEMQKKFCDGKQAAIPACSELDTIFHPLYTAKPSLRLPYLKLKMQELLLYLHTLCPEETAMAQHIPQQTELIKEIHSLLTGHLDQRFTIEDLSKQYLINTSTLKEVFKAVYGLPIATYMKEYRMRQAMKLLRETDDTIAAIAAQVGYETQGKFSKAFRDVVHILPTEYRKTCRAQTIVRQME